MSEKINSYCAICGKGYHLCIPCDHTKDLYPWKIYTDTSEHYKIFQILHGLSTNIYTKEEAKERLQTVDLSDLNELREDIRDRIKDIMSEKPKTNNKKVINKNVDKAE